MSNNFHLKTRLQLIMTYVPAEQYHHGIGFSRNKSKQEDISATTIVAFEHRISKLAILMQRDFFALSTNQMIDNMATI